MMISSSVSPITIPAWPYFPSLKSTTEPTEASALGLILPASPITPSKPKTDLTYEIQLQGLYGAGTWVNIGGQT